MPQLLWRMVVAEQGVEMTTKHEDKMIKNARKKFVLGSTAATFAAVFMLVLAINIVRYVQVQRQQEETLLSLSETGLTDAKDKKGYGNHPQDDADIDDDFWDDIEDMLFPDDEEKDGWDKGRKGNRGSAEMQFGDRYFEITVLSDGTTNLRTRNTDAMSGEDAGEIAAEILAEGKETGYRDDYRYQVRTNPDGTTVVSLLDCTMDAKSLSDLRMVTVVVGLFGTLAAFFFILFTSRKAVMPLAESMEKQKRFITDAGHELKTPLSVIATNMDILAMDYGENEWIEGTKKQVSRLRKLVNNLVSLSKLDEQDTALVFERFSISDAAYECVDLYSSVAESVGKRIEADIEEDVNVTADENSIRQIFAILMDNAIKYAEGDRVISVRLRREGKKVLFETENDWARNVDASKLDTLFDRFTRGDRSRSGADGKSGFGLGLAIARAAAEKNHATLTASETAEGKLRFTLGLHG